MERTITGSYSTKANLLTASLLLFVAISPLAAQEKNSGKNKKVATVSAQPPDNGRVPSAAPTGSPDSPSSKDYRVGAGDLIEVFVWKEPEVTSTVVIRPDGKISLPLINDISVAGKTPMEIQQIVEEKLDPFIKSANVTVTVKDIRSKKVYVIGQVGRTGAYEINQPTTVLQILTEAGGLQPFAKGKDIYVLRNGEDGKQQRFAFNYKDVVSGKKIEQNILLREGDTVVVP